MSIYSLLFSGLNGDLACVSIHSACRFTVRVDLQCVSIYSGINCIGMLLKLKNVIKIIIILIIIFSAILKLLN